MGAPDKIWLDWPEANKGDPVFDEPPENKYQAAQTKYVRGDIAAVAIETLAEARAAWIAYQQASTTKEHFAAVDRLNEALGVGEMDVGECG